MWEDGCPFLLLLLRRGHIRILHSELPECLAKKSGEKMTPRTTKDYKYDGIDDPNFKDDSPDYDDLQELAKNKALCNYLMVIPKCEQCGIYMESLLVSDEKKRGRGRTFFHVWFCPKCHDCSATFSMTANRKFMEMHWGKENWKKIMEDAKKDKEKYRRERLRDR